MSERSRQTLAVPSSFFRGVGLHSGADAAVRFLPAPAGAGLVFRDAHTGQEIPARAANVTDTSRCTRLAQGEREVQTVEHVLSALAGLGIDDAVIEFEGPEMPAADGSAAPFVQMLREAGLAVQPGQTVTPITLNASLFVSEGEAALAAFPADQFEATVVLDYPRQAYLGTLAARFVGGRDDYAAWVAPARTFGFVAELEMLKARGLALGATRDNAVALGQGGYETPLRFPDELARHKLLDLIGDLALAGRPVHARILALMPGHTLNTRLAGLLAAQDTSTVGDHFAYSRY